MRRVPWWGVVSAGLAPVFMIGGWTLAAARQPAGFNPVRDTISALAGLGATDRWLMTAAFVGTGLAHLVTALALRPAGTGGRLLLALGSLAVWPALAWRRPVLGADESAPRAGPAAGPLVVLTVFLLALLGWFVAQLVGDGSMVGLSERFAAGAESLAPLAVAVVLVGRSSRRSGP